MIKKKLTVTLALVMSLLIASSVFTGFARTSTKAAKGKQVLRFIYGVGIPNFDPQLANSMVAQTVGTALLEGLVRENNGKIVPAGAKSWTISKDGKTYTFALRDTKWSDGKPVTANDYEYSIKRMADPKTAAPYAFATYYILNAQKYNEGKIKDASLVGVKAINSKTLQIKLVNPAPYILGVLCGVNFCPSRKDIVEKYGKDFAAAPDKMVYNGPFTLSNWVREKEVDIVKNPKYWNAKNIKLDEVDILQVDNRQTRVNMYENGDVDMLDINGATYEQYVKDGKEKVMYFSDGGVGYLTFNAKSKNPITRNKNFRKAIAYGFDRAEFVKLNTKGLNAPAQRLIVPQISGVNTTFDKEHPLNYYPVNADLKKAKEYLSKAMKELNITDPAKMTFDYLTYDSSKTEAELVQAMLKKSLGVTMNIQLAPYADQIDRCLKLDYDVAAQGWCPDYDDAMTYLDMWTTGSGQNSIGMSNTMYDKLIAKAKATADPSTRGILMAQAEKLLLDEGYIMPTSFSRWAWVAKPYVKGVNRFFVGANPDIMNASVAGK